MQFQKSQLIWAVRAVYDSLYIDLSTEYVGVFVNAVALWRKAVRFTRVMSLFPLFVFFQDKFRTLKSGAIDG